MGYISILFRALASTTIPVQPTSCVCIQKCLFHSEFQDRRGWEWETGGKKTMALRHRLYDSGQQHFPLGVFCSGFNDEKRKASSCRIGDSQVQEYLLERLYDGISRMKRPYQNAWLGSTALGESHRSQAVIVNWAAVYETRSS